MNTDARTKTILSILSKTYPQAHIALSYQSSWELLVAVILSAQCTDLVVNKITKTLFKKYPTLDVYIHAKQKDFEKDIRSTGFYHNKAKNILASAKIIHDKYGGHVPKTMKDMLKLPGVARKTANVVLSNIYGVVEGIAVDTHVIRLSQRLRLVPLEKIGGKKNVFINQSLVTRHMSTIIDYIKDASPLKIECELMSIIPKNHWFDLTYQLIDHGRAICNAQHPKCKICPLASYCPSKR